MGCKIHGESLAQVYFQFNSGQKAVPAGFLNGKLWEIRAGCRAGAVSRRTFAEGREVSGFSDIM